MAFFTEWVNKHNDCIGIISSEVYSAEFNFILFIILKKNQMESIKNNRDFLTVYRTGKSYANRYLVMYLATAQEGHDGRLGISVSKKVGNSVVRHRVKRLIKESYRLNENRFRTGCDIVVVARKDAKGRNYSEIESALLHLARLHGLLTVSESRHE